jgi:hypothetical protein
MRAFLLAAILFLGGCAASGRFDASQLAKTDIDRVAEAHRQEAFASLRLLAEKLYRRNPREWRKGGQGSAEEAVARLFDPKLAWRLPELGDRHGTDAVLVAFRDDYRGDRVAAFIGGLGGMMHVAFNEKSEFFVIDDLDPQKLYNSARNVEIAVWKLSNARDAEGNLFLISNEPVAGAAVQNLSFEREFGKIIGGLDVLAKIMADKVNRTVVKVVQGLATAIFLPVPSLK